MTCTQLIYTSQPFGFDDAIMSGILRQARRNNARDGITGALICRDDLYLQLLEGDADLIDAAFARIEPDDRHLSPQVIWRGQVSERLFPTWAMRDDPARTWMWTAAEVRSGAARCATPHEVRGIFARIAAETG